MVVLEREVVGVLDVFHFDSDLAALAGELDGVSDEIEDYLLDPLFIGVDLNLSFELIICQSLLLCQFVEVAVLNFDLYSSLLCFVFLDVGDLFDCLLQIEALDVLPKLVGLYLSKVEDVIDKEA